MFFLHYQKTLRIVNVSESDAGDYRCMARNLLGSVHHTIRVMVKGVSAIKCTFVHRGTTVDPCCLFLLRLSRSWFMLRIPQGTAFIYSFLFSAAPYWISAPPRNLVLAPGENGVLTCRASGVPKPSISWAMNSIPIESECHVIFTLEQNILKTWIHDMYENCGKPMSNWQALYVNTLMQVLFRVLGFLHLETE